MKIIEKQEKKYSVKVKQRFQYGLLVYKKWSLLLTKCWWFSETFFISTITLSFIYNKVEAALLLPGETNTKTLHGVITFVYFRMFLLAVGANSFILKMYTQIQNSSWELITVIA